ncbi:MAG: rod shape-determining protein MreC [Epsilonproteobacteria bacterium]|nr:rod shape-determining protein MreC [Campylobacterota bacterium]
MNKKLIFIALIILSSFVVFQKEDEFQKEFSFISIPIKRFFLEIENSLKGYVNTYINQIETIKRLKEENILLRKYLYHQEMTIEKLENYSKSKVQKYDANSDVIRIQTISYKKLNDFSYIYLTGEGTLKDDKIYGLIQRDVAAGIAIKNGEHLEGILLSNEKCQFSTFVGEDRMPGIAKGIDEKRMEVNFIPKWSKISVGDKVITSGLDNIFLANIPVGVVSEVVTRSTYKTAIIETYADVLHPNYFYLVKKVPIHIYDTNTTLLINDSNSSIKG